MQITHKVSRIPSSAVKRDLLALDLDATNEYLSRLSAMERINWAVDTFGTGLYTLTSAGIDSVLMLDHSARADRPIPVIHINTGFLPEETLTFRDSLVRRYGFQLYEFGPSKKQIADTTASKLWESDLAAYGKITKLDPMAKAVRKLSVTALLAGIRGDQTENRARLGYIARGNNGELRIHPFIDWSKAQVTRYIDSNKLPRNPLYDKGYGSVGDQQVTVPGQGRTGREVMECGLHMVDGKLVRRQLL